MWKQDTVAAEGGPRGRLVKPCSWRREAAVTRINIFLQVPVLHCSAEQRLVHKHKCTVHRGNLSGRKLQCISPREAMLH